MEHVTVWRIARESLRMLGHGFARALPVWLFAAVSFTGTNLVDIVYGAPVAGHGLTHAQMVSLGIRLISPLIVSCAAWRIMLDSEDPPWSLNWDFWKYALATLLLIAVGFGIALAGVKAAQPFFVSVLHDKTQQNIARGALAFALILLATIVTIRISLWPVALAIGDRAVTFRTAWRSTRGAALAMIGALILVATPWFAGHFATTIWAQSLTGDRQITATVIDGIVSVLQVAFGVAVTAAAYVLLAKR
jgi:hypothetical protein